MRKSLKATVFFLSFALFLLVGEQLNAQDQATGPVGGNAMSAARDGAIPINFYTGMPSISVPLFNYSGTHNLSLSLSLDYFAGGIKPSDAPASVGLGWNINVGGVVTRNVRGIADDLFAAGHLYSAALSDDERANFYNYGKGCSDAEMDVYHYNVNGMSGSFYIGNNREVTTDPGSHVKISFALDSFPEDADGLGSLGDQVSRLRSFTVVTDGGTRYVFNNVEYQTSYAGLCGASFKLTYGTAWYLSSIVAAYSTDSIKINYTTLPSTQKRSLVQTHKITGSSHSHSSIGYVYDTVDNRVPIKIYFPDSTYIDFVYSKPNQFRYGQYPLLQRIKFSDTAFRYGYRLNWDTSAVGSLKRDFLVGVNKYTATKLMPGYSFTYTSPIADLNPDLNQRDHWGYYNGLNTGKDSTVPTVSGIYTGVDRSANSNAMASSLASVKDPSGGTTYYKFENNDVLPVTNTAQYISINGAITTSTAVTITKDHSKLCPFELSFSQTFGRSLTSPISGPGKMNFSVTSTDGLTTYYTTTIDLKAIYYNGSALVAPVLNSGSYLIKTSLQAGTSSSVNLPIYVSWINQTATGANSTLTGGIRIKQITHYDPLYNKIDTISTYRYVTIDGKSSGRGSAIPFYNFTTAQLTGTGGSVIAGSLSTNIVSNPADIFTFADPSYVGYSRVEVYRGSLAHNLGKQVYEFTGADEGYINSDPVSFPFLPRPGKIWAAGFPKRILVYDSLGRLIKLTQNTYSLLDLDLSGYNNYRSLKISQVSTGTVQFGIEAVKHYTGRWYFPSSGIAQMSATVDTFYHPDLSYTSSRQLFEYDSRFNPKKLVTDFDKTLGLIAEKRFYYTYDYTMSGAIASLKIDSIFIPISTETWITGDGNPRMISGEITNFENVGAFKGAKIWPSAHYVFESNKPIAQGIIGTFNAGLLKRNTNYWQTRDTLIWNSKNETCVQTTDVRTNTSASIIYGYKSRKYPIAKVSNAESSLISYTSFETDEGGGWTIPSFTPYTLASITGNAAYPLSSGTITKTSVNTSVNFIITYWAKAGSSVSVIGASPVLQDSQNGWNFYFATVTGYSTIYISGSGYIDELRMYPKDANMVTTTYNRMGQVTSVCDANNTVVYSYYDSTFRLKLVRDKDMNIVKKYEYPNDIVNINQTSNWVATSPVIYQCQTDPLTHYYTGIQLKSETDNNYYSEDYLTIRNVSNGTNYITCPLPPPPPPECGSDIKYKLIGGVCETACKQYLSSYYKRVTDVITGGQVYRWFCTWRYKWSDNSTSPEYQDVNVDPCPLGTFCELE